MKNDEKLTDEKALFNYIANDICGSVKPLYLRKRIVGEILDLIHSLRSENADQKAEIERLTEEANEDTITHIDLCTENASLRRHNIELQKQVDELTGENGYLKQCSDNFLADYQKAQKQVDELLNRKIEPKIIQCHVHALETCPKIEQAVKDTAREILYDIKYGFVFAYKSKNEAYQEGYDQALEDYDNELEKLFKERYGVEVE